MVLLMKRVLVPTLLSILSGCGGQDFHFDSDITGLTAAVATTVAPNVARTCGSSQDSYRSEATYEVETTSIGLRNSSVDIRIRC